MSHMICGDHRVRAVVLSSGRVVHRKDGRGCNMPVVVNGYYYDGMWEKEFGILSNKR